MKDIEILTERSYQHWPSWAVVYEWEDVMTSVLGGELIDLHKGRLGGIARNIRKLIRKISIVPSTFNWNNSKPIRFIWIMDAKIYKEYNYTNCIPIFLDFSVDMIDIIIKATSKLPFFWVTSLSIYEMMKNKCQNVHYIPLSISDKWIRDDMPNKTIDVIQFGRKNEILHQYMMKYCETHKNIDYVYQTADGTLSYTSTIRGNIGRFDTRYEYMKMIASSRVSLVSTPGIDKGKNFGGIDFFTPRFYESASQYCHMIGRYTYNTEADYIHVHDVCKHVQSEQEFHDTLEDLLQTDNECNVAKYRSFLQMNSTSQRVKEIYKIISEM